MTTFKILILIILCSAFANLYGIAPVFPANKPDTKPHRIIRTCCSFGTEMQMVALPGIKLTEITSLDKIGSHHYLGDQSEENGIVYTRRGGFIDMGHLRDQVDWTAYLYKQLTENKPAEHLELVLGHEGGEKTLSVTIPTSLTDNDLVLLAGKITYDLSVWHEIATWFGASTIPFVPERYSSFSIEDAFSNLVGVTIGIKALQSELPFEEAVTRIIAETLKSMDVVTSEAETYLAMESVRDIWWTREKKLPSSRVLLQRQLQVYPCLQPWLVPGWASTDQDPIELLVPEFSSIGEKLNDYYQLEFRLNYKFPFRKMFPERKDRNITQNDFDRLLTEVASELNKKESKFR
ncbi:MAG: DUF4056 domain-containing protein [Bacteroidota bacterium]|nr:hypothetical protein [Odoribacter sp.]MDP3643430.1 DUF4056 domain-containing protein [Bacteroidota bacterium]